MVVWRVGLTCAVQTDSVALCIFDKGGKAVGDGEFSLQQFSPCRNGFFCGLGTIRTIEENGCTAVTGLGVAVVPNHAGRTVLGVIGWEYDETESVAANVLQGLVEYGFVKGFGAIQIVSVNTKPA